MKSVKKKIIVIIMLMVLIALAISCYFLFPNKEESVEEREAIEEVQEEIIEEPINRYKENKSINDDYVGGLYFKSGLIDLPVVEAKGELDDYTFYAFNTGNPVTNYDLGCESGPCSLNDVYLRKDWISGEYELGGSIFMDYRNDLYDQNLIIYGHLYPKSMDKDRKLMFSGLDLLLDKDNYELNSEICLELENETREYKIAYVYLFDVTSDDYDNLQYYRTNYEYDYYGDLDEDYYDEYISRLEQAKLYDTGVKLTSKDNTLTLQTCFDGNDNLVEIVVAKEIR